jgi:hypothetical protein
MVKARDVDVWKFHSKAHQLAQLACTNNYNKRKMLARAATSEGLTRVGASASKMTRSYICCRRPPCLGSKHNGSVPCLNSLSRKHDCVNSLTIQHLPSPKVSDPRETKKETTTLLNAYF